MKITTFVVKTYFILNRVSFIHYVFPTGYVSDPIQNAMGNQTIWHYQDNKLVTTWRFPHQVFTEDFFKVQAHWNFGSQTSDK